MKKIKAFWASLDDACVISKRELFLGLTTCVLAGIVFGVFFGPKKDVAIGSHNYGNGCDNSASQNKDSKAEKKQEK